jgi:hypothetical protein
MAFHREIDGSEPVRPEPVERLGGRHELRREQAVWHLATGSLACPACDAPVFPEAGGMAPHDAMACGFCDHIGALRDFLSLAEPTRPTRVDIRVRGLALR